MHFVRNAWYVACWEHELSDRPLERTILEQPVVLFRGKDGKPAGLLDRCPHRAVPLSMGKVVDGTLQCAYHGLRFDCSGVCVENPHSKGRPDLWRTPSFPVHASYGMVWIWMGDAARAKPELIPDFSYFSPGHATYTTVRGGMQVKADYRLIVDNLLDLSHGEFLHANTVGIKGASGSVKSSVASGEGTVTVLRKVMNLPPAAVWKKVWTKSERVDQDSNITWFAPSNMLIDIALMEPGKAREPGAHMPAAHLLTPQTATTTLYHFAFARDFLVDDEAHSARMLETATRAFAEEDRPVIEAAQTRLAQASDGFEMADFTIGDGGATRARRMIDKLIEAERGGELVSIGRAQDALTRT